MKGIYGANKILLKTAYKQPFEYNTFLNLHTLSMRQHFFGDFKGTCC